MTITQWGVYGLFFILQSATIVFVWLVYRRPVTIISENKDTPLKEKRQNSTETTETFRPHPMVEQKWEEEVKRTIEYQCLSIRNAVFKQTIDIHRREIELAPKDFLFDREILIRIYTPNELDIIDRFIQTFDAYLAECWYTKDGKLKTVFSGRISNVHSEAGNLIHRSKYLTQELDHLLKQLQFTSKH